MSNSVPRSGAAGTTVNTGSPALAAVATTDSVTLAIVVSPGMKMASAPRLIVDWIASTTPEEFSTAASSSSSFRGPHAARASSM